MMQRSNMIVRNGHLYNHLLDTSSSVAGAGIGTPSKITSFPASN
jgi:hypothetical protein